MSNPFKALGNMIGSFAEWVGENRFEHDMYNKYGPLWRENFERQHQMDVMKMTEFAQKWEQDKIENEARSASTAKTKLETELLNAKLAEGSGGMREGESTIGFSKRFGMGAGGKLEERPETVAPQTRAEIYGEREAKRKTAEDEFEQMLKKSKEAREAAGELRASAKEARDVTEEPAKRRKLESEIGENLAQADKARSDIEQRKKGKPEGPQPGSMAYQRLLLETANRLDPIVDKKLGRLGRKDLADFDPEVLVQAKQILNNQLVIDRMPKHGGEATQESAAAPGEVAMLPEQRDRSAEQLIDRKSRAGEALTEWEKAYLAKFGRK